MFLHTFFVTTVLFYHVKVNSYFAFHGHHFLGFSINLAQVVDRIMPSPAPPPSGVSDKEPACQYRKQVKVKSLSRVRLFATPWTAAYQAPPSMGFSRQEYWSGLPLPSPGGLPLLFPTGNIREVDSISRSGRSPGGRHGNPLQYFAWRILWTEEPGGLQSVESQRVRHN